MYMNKGDSKEGLQMITNELECKNLGRWKEKSTRRIEQEGIKKNKDEEKEKREDKKKIKGDMRK